MLGSTRNSDIYEKLRDDEDNIKQSEAEQKRKQEANAWHEWPFCHPKEGDEI